MIIENNEVNRTHARHVPRASTASGKLYNSKTLYSVRGASASDSGVLPRTCR